MKKETPKGIIAVHDLSLAYDRRETVLEKVTFSVRAGELVFITGKSGSGKSSLLKSFYGALPPLGGEIIIGGTRLHGLSKGQVTRLRRNIGIVFQDYQLIREWNIAKNVALPLLIGGYSKEVTDAQVSKLLEHVKLGHRHDRYPEELSGGEQQRAAVARALAHNPSLILADEPTGNLDDYSTDLVMDLLVKVRELGKTVVVVTHRMPKNLTIPFRHFHIENKKVHEYI